MAVYTQLVDKTPVAVSNAPQVYRAEPWKNQLVNSINHEPARATTCLKEMVTNFKFRQNGIIMIFT
ncbi:hypothetical protein [Mucilaginibacter lacusdianchii]|uniref:hypothetical protein n=1 Tax=Mucilaginibacter lacusdianchii TaxID=2684211 RepID=UPI00131E1B8B|nr:hypothetical protein [Mucilaginibacter sp. JXJ CY 39]